MCVMLTEKLLAFCIASAWKDTARSLLYACFVRLHHIGKYPSNTAAFVRTAVVGCSMLLDQYEIRWQELASRLCHLA